MPEVLRVIQVPRTARRLLDVGSSHSLYSVELCRIHPNLTAKVPDLHITPSPDSGYRRS
jgi:hypothetical protein